MKPTSRVSLCGLLVLAGLAGRLGADSLTLSPAVVPLSGAPGQSASYRLALRNGTSEPLGFTLEAQDVVVRDGARNFVAAGELADSVAATVIFRPARVEIGAGEIATVEVMMTLPPTLRHRAIVTLFRADRALERGGTRALLSVGTLFTFALGGPVSVDAGEIATTPPGASANAHFSLPLVNDGTEPLVIAGLAAIVDDAGRLIGKAAFERRRLLPGERATLEAEYGGELASGDYRVLATLDVAGNALVRAAELRVAAVSP